MGLMNKGLSAVLVGYHGKENFGDDVFRRVVTKYLATNMNVSSCAIACGARSELKLSNDIESLKIIPFGNRLPFIPRLRWLFIFMHALKADMLVFAAGSIFTHQEFQEMRFLLTALKKLKVKKAFKILALGVSIGPFPNEKKRADCGELLNVIDLIVLRDVESVSELKDMKFQKNAHLGNDLALMLDIEKYQPRNKSDSKLTLGISITPRAFPGALNNRSNQSFVGFTKTLSEALAQNENLSISVMSFCGDKMDGDNEISEMLVTRLEPWKDRVELVLYSDERFGAFMRKLYACDALIAGRMHAGIMGIRAGIPVFQLAYARKVFDFYEHQQLGTMWVADTGNLDSKRIVEFLNSIGTSELNGYFLEQKLNLLAKSKILTEKLDHFVKTVPM